MRRKPFKRVLPTLLALLLTLSLFPAVAAAETEAVTLTILHVNDRHGRMDADPYISQLAKGIPGNVLILDAGDALHGQTAANLSKGEAMVGVMNAVGYSAMVPGNHDFNFGVERLLVLSKMMDFPLLAANIRTANGETLFRPYEVFKLDGVTVGVFGLTTPETVTASDPRNVAGLQFDDPAQTAEAMVAALKAEGCEIIIALAHLGRDESSEPADRSDALASVPGIDVIIDGHSHDALDNGLLAGDALIVQTGEHGKNIGVVEITASGKTARLIEVNDELAADEDIAAAIEDANAKIEHITAAVVGATPVLLQGERAQVRTGETNLANLITDSMRWATGADIAFLTGGNIRTSIAAGEITMGQVLTVLPFSNLLVTVELTGEELLGVLEHGVSEYPEEAGKHIQVSGLSFSFDPDAAAGLRVHSVKLANGGPLDISKTYTVATIEFLAFGGDGYDIDSGSLVYYGGDADALAIYLATEPTIVAEAEGRVSALARFDDVPKDAWYFPAVSHVAAKGLIPSGGSFGPNTPVTADEMSGLLSALLADGETSVKGEDSLTRERLAAMLTDFLSGHGLSQTGAAPDYADAALIGGDYLEAVAFAYKTGLMIGSGGKFDPKGVVTRAQAAAVLYNVMEACLMDGPSKIAENAFEFFLEISKVPRGSGNMQGISDFLKAFGEERGLETVQDEVLNIFIKKPGSTGRENEPPIILQAHMDMVCEKNEDVKHDFLKDPIIPVIDGDWVTAGGTTLGADNGAGLSIILALLDADGLSHPPIEALITVDEETTTDGAFEFDTSLLKGRRLINLDSEDEGIFTVSSAAAGSATVIIPVETVAISAGAASYKLTLKGLTGGHSGVDIHKGLANANILMARLLKELSIVNYQLSIITGGSAQNAIPRECTAILSFAAKDLESVQSAVAEAQAAFKAEFPEDKDLTITLEKTDAPKSAISGNSLENVLDGILNMPNGALVMSSDIEGLTQTSNNLGVVTTEADTVTLLCFARSSEPAEQLQTLDAIQALTDSIGAAAEIINAFPAWPYKADSPLRDKMAGIFKDMYGREPLIEAIHAGLECGIFAQSIPNCDIISIGPDVLGAHSPDERMPLSSFYRTVDFVVKVLEQI